MKSIFPLLVIMSFMTCLQTGCGSKDEAGSGAAGSSESTDVSSGDASEAASTSGMGVVMEGFIDGGTEGAARKSLFCFATGKLIAYSEIAKLVPGQDGGAIAKQIGADVDLKAKIQALYDLSLDAQFGIACNAEFSGWELGVGTGGILHLGEGALSDYPEVPDAGYVAVVTFEGESLPPALGEFPTMQVGHVYAVRSGLGKYGKLLITAIARDQGTVTFDWQFQPNGSRSFDGE